MVSLEAAFIERSWVKFKSDTRYYYFNKALGFLVACSMAFITINIRSRVKPADVLCSTEDYRFIYWMLYVFYSF